MKVTLLYRTASILLLLFAAGHTIGFRQVDSAWRVDSLVDSMKSTHFNANGSDRTYWEFFVGFGLLVTAWMVFAAIVGGLYVSLGPTVGAVITILLAEGLRIGFGTAAVGWDNLVYGVLLVLFIIFLPKGILGSVIDRLKTQRKPALRS